jgi:predicted alpha-1,2-mannosidase
MKKLFFLPALFLAACALGQKNLVRYVDPFIGTGGHGHTFPGATLPFGMVQLSPDNGTQGWDWCSGYHFSDSVLAGFSHTHLSGTGIGDLCDISVMPLANAMADTVVYRDKYSHQNEKAFPGYYQVFLQQSGINAELTASRRVGVHRYTFPASEKAMIKIDLGFAINWDKATECHLRQVSPTRFVGYRRSTGWAKKQVVYFALDISKPVNDLVLFADKKKAVGTTATAQDVKAFLQFSTREKEQIILKVGLSFASVEGAIASLKETDGKTFDVVQKEATASWEKELSKVIVNSKDESFLRTFYTAFYHTCMAPFTFSDATGSYTGADGKVHQSATPVYSVHSLWDTFRGANPLNTVFQTERVPHIIQSYLSFYKQYGLLPVWDLYFNETNTMTGYHAVPVIADAILKGIKGFDYNLAYEAMKASAMQNTRATDYYRQFGFVPQDKHGWSVTMTLEYAYDDWCIAQVAKKLGKQDEYEMFTTRSLSYRKLFDAKTGFFRAKNKNGKWVEPFDSYYSEHGFEGMYIEGTAWQHTFFVPHAVEDYARLLGGTDKLLEKLDTLFTTTSQMRGENVSSDISGLIGQYAHGNEPSHHIAYMYTALGKPHKAAERCWQVMTTLYSDKPDGLAGNEDCGQMSAWYVWSAMGMYPMNASSGKYLFGTPMVDKATIKLPNGKSFAIEVKRASPASKYIQSVQLNRKTIPVKEITHLQLMQGGKLQFVLTDQPQ